VTADALIFEPLHADHEIATLSCGVASLDRYLREQAGQDRRRRLASTFIMRLPASRAVLGYYTLSNYSVIRTDLPDATRKRVGRYQSVPATLIGRLAVSRDQQGRQYGRRLVGNALERSLTNEIASALIVVDALDEGAAAFYHAVCFEHVPGDPLRLYILMETVRKALQP